MVGMAKPKEKPVYELKFGVMLAECYVWNGRFQRKVCMGVEDWGDLGRSYLVGDHRVASDGCYEWYGKECLKQVKCSYHLCQDDRKKCRDYLSRGDSRELVHVSRWRLVNVFMMSEMEYSE